MANQMATGAVHVFIRWGNTPNSPAPGSGLIYMGTCDRMPQDNRSPEYELLMNDMSGSKKPLDLAWEGEDALISCVFTRFNERAAQLLETKPVPTINANGSWSYSDVGSLMGFENMAWELWLTYTFGPALANKAAYVSSSLRAGRYYPQCVVWAPTTEDYGTSLFKRHLVFYAWPKLTVNGPNKIFQLYSTGVGDAAFSSINASLIT